MDVLSSLTASRTSIATGVVDGSARQQIVQRFWFLVVWTINFFSKTRQAGIAYLNKRHLLSVTATHPSVVIGRCCKTRLGSLSNRGEKEKLPTAL
jgi:hypothetical protein